MRYQTELMRSILKNEKAQEIIDYVSQIYGNSYVALWIYQAMGIILGEIYDIASQLRYETTPATAKLLLAEWEAHYGLATDNSLTEEQRQLRLIAKSSSRGPCNPARLEANISAALGGVKVEIVENVAKNTFLVNIREVVNDFKPAIAVLEKMKPSHLIYRMQIATQMVSTADLKVAIAATFAERQSVEFKYEEIVTSVFIDSNGVLVYIPTPALLTDGTVAYYPLLHLSDDGIITF